MVILIFIWILYLPWLLHKQCLTLTQMILETLSILLSCLSTKFGFTGTVLRWFTTYPLDCFQSVKNGSMISEFSKLNFGVPQGSVLGRLLFSLYTSPLSQVMAKYMDVKYHFYADDSQLFIHLSPGNCANSFHQFKACLNNINTWMFENKLKLNPPPPKNRVYSLWFFG